MYELTGWDLLALLGTVFALGMLLGAKLTADTLRNRRRPEGLRGGKTVD